LIARHTTEKARLIALAKDKLGKQLETDPQNNEKARQYAHYCRMTGDLDGAAKIFGELHKKKPDDRLSAYLHRALTNARVSDPSPDWDHIPAPIVHKPDFLEPVKRGALMEAALAHQSDFSALAYSRASEERELRLERDKALRNQIGIVDADWARQLIAPKILHCLPELFETFAIEPFPARDLTVNVTLTHNGHYGRPHVDVLDGSFKISFLYYFRRRPRQFRGGDLLIYDQPKDQLGGYNPSLFTKIDHRDNLFLAFPCEYCHEITEVETGSAKFEDGRFALSGFIRTKDR